MLDLDTIITRFVDDVLRAVRAASLEELEELLDPGAASQASTPAAAAPRAALRPGRRRQGRKPVGRAPRSVKVRREEREVAVGADITDPEALLAAAFASPPPSMPDEPATPTASSEPPESTETPRATVARLRSGETLARDAGHGVVIRRAKKA